MKVDFCYKLEYNNQDMLMTKMYVRVINLNSNN